MSIVLSQHANRLRFDAASRPTSPQVFTFVEFVKVSTLPAAGNFDQMFFMQGATAGGTTSGIYLYVASDGSVRAGADWGSNESATVGVLAPSATSGAGWAAIVLRANGTGPTAMRASMRPAGGSITHASFPLTTAVTLVQEMMLGSALADGLYGISTFKGRKAHAKMWDAYLSDDEVLAEVLSGPPVRTAGLLHYRAMTATPIAAALAPTLGSGTLAILAGGTDPATSTDNPVFGGTQPTVVIGAASIAGQAVTVSGTLTSAAGSPAVSVRLNAGATGTSQGPATATVTGTAWTVTVAGVPAGVYTPQATVTDANGTAQATGSGLEIIGLSGAGVLPHIYSAGAITLAPASASTTVNGTTTLTITDQSGLPLDGVVVTSSNTGVATVSSPSNAQGQVTVTGRAAGAAVISASFSDATAGTLSASSAISVGLATPAAPSGLTATAQGATSVRLAWTDNANNETGQIVERAPSVNGAPGTFATILTAAASVVQVDDTTVAGPATYFYRVRSTNGSGTSAPSNVASVVVPAPPDTTPPLIALAASAATVTVANSTVVLTAQASDNVAVTEVRFYRNGAQIGSPVTAPNAGMNYSATIGFATSAENGTVTFTARAFDAAGNSTLSSAVTVTVNIPLPVTAPAAPSSLAVSEVTQTSMRLTWQDNSTDETAMLVERAIGASGAWQQVASLPAGTTTWLATGLLQNTLHRWRVRAQGAQQASGYSNEASGTTLAPATTGLTTLTASRATVSDSSGKSVTVTYTALNGNGSSRPGVTITPTFAAAGFAAVTPATGLTDATGRASFTVTFGDVIGQTQLLVAASDGATTLSSPATPVVEVFTLPAFTEALVRELQAEQVDPKYAEEIQPYIFDFSPFLGRGESVLSVLSMQVVPLGGVAADPTAQQMVFGEPRVVGARVLCYFRDGVPGVAYYLRCKAKTSIGRVVVSEIRLRIYRGTGARVSGASPVVD